jgi:hypothetical protein
MRECIHVSSTPASSSYLHVQRFACGQDNTPGQPHITARQLDLLTREFEHADAAKPRVTLCATSHIAEAAFYANIHAHLDGLDLVLYEGVREHRDVPASGGVDPAAAAAVTSHNQRWLMILAERFRKREGHQPEDLEELLEWLPPRVRTWAWWAAHDGWGRRQEVRFSPRGIEVVSLGADGQPGGTGEAADISSGDQRRIRNRELRLSSLFSRSASALRLADQTEHIDVHRERWRPCDRTVTELCEHAGPEVGLAVRQVIQRLQGRTFGAHAAALALDVVGLTAGTANAARIVFIEGLDAAINETDVEPGDEAQDDEDAARMQSAIVDFRNQHVIDEILRESASSSPPRTIGVLYGAAHMAGIESVLRSHGYRGVKDTWYPAVRATDALTLSPRDVVGLVATKLAMRLFAAMLRMMPRLLPDRSTSRPCPLVRHRCMLAHSRRECPAARTKSGRRSIDQSGTRSQHSLRGDQLYVLENS